MSTYHIDPVAGDDANRGLSHREPRRSWVNLDLRAGDAVLFRRGSVVRGTLDAQEGSPLAPITYGAYGDGERPAFLGSVPVSDPLAWVEERRAVWRYTGVLPSEACNIVFDGGERCGILRWSPEELGQPGDWHFTAIGGSSGVESSKERPTEPGTLLLYSGGNPAREHRDIECVLWGARRMARGKRHVVFEGLSFRNSGVHGYQDSGVEDVLIRDCEFRFIGGAVWHRGHRIRFGNGVELWDGARDVTVERCRFRDIYDSAVTHQGGGTRHVPERIAIRDNLFVGCGLCAYESREPARDVRFEHNTCVDGGGGFAAQGEVPPRPTDPYPQPVGYHVFVFLIDAGTQPGPITIGRNILGPSSGAAISAIVAPADLGRFAIDENCYHPGAGGVLMQASRLREGTVWSEAMLHLVATGELASLLAEERSWRTVDLDRYREETGMDRHSIIAEAWFRDAEGGDYRQRPGSPAAGMGVRSTP